VPDSALPGSIARPPGVGGTVSGEPALCHRAAGAARGDRATVCSEARPGAVERA